jgi:hypothetical protein
LHWIQLSEVLPLLSTSSSSSFFILVHVVPSSLHHPNMYPHQPSWTKVFVNWNVLGSRCLESTSKIWAICLDFETFNQVKVPSWAVTMQYLWDVWLATVVELCTFQQLQLQVAKKRV